MQELVKKPDSLPCHPFRWRDSAGNFHDPEKMATRHLFHVCRMIWDHAMPKAMQTTFRNRYVFGPAYTLEYFATAIRVCLPILLTRPDLEPYMCHWLRFMEQCLRTAPRELAIIRLITEQKD